MVVRGGTQTIAIACLIHQGRLPKPDRIVIADTGREFSATWEYTEKHVAPLLAEVGLKIEVASHDLAKVDLYSSKSKGLLIPAYDARPEGSGAKLPTFCSSEWKKLVVRRHIGGYEANKGGVIMWMGMSLDEKGRMKKSDVDWIEHQYPLITMVPKTRQECKDYIQSYGLPFPIKSRCYMCPHQGDDEWIEVQQEPEEWAKAVALDDQIFASHNVRLHSSLKPLSQVVFVARKKDTQEPLFDCNSGGCWT